MKSKIKEYTNKIKHLKLRKKGAEILDKGAGMLFGSIVYFLTRPFLFVPDQVRKLGENNSARWMVGASWTRAMICETLAGVT